MQKILDPRSLIAAEFLILGTSLSGQDYPAVEVVAAWLLRSQIEPVFKRLKSLLHFDQLRARTDIDARRWLYPHLILDLLCNDLGQAFLEVFPRYLPLHHLCSRQPIREAVLAAGGTPVRAARSR